MLASRLPLATGWGFFLALATFWLLWLTINTPLSVGQRVIATPIEFTRMITDSTPVTRQPREKPERITPDVIGPPGRVEVTREPPVRTKVGPGPAIRIDTPAGPVGPMTGMDGDPIPRVRIEPDYPPSALRRGIEGWVLVQFSVTATGQVTDVFVVEATPPGVFDDETLEAVRRWLYHPEVKDGRPVERVGTQTVIRFNLP